MTALLLDTHAWVWWIGRPEKLTRIQRNTIERARRTAPLLLSVISCWEVALLCQHGRLRFTIPIEAWLEQATAVAGIQVLPLSLPIIVTGARLVALRDPADMLIVATAQHHNARLVTGDLRIAESELVSVVG